jgi:hypothetical protein
MLGVLPGPEPALAAPDVDDEEDGTGCGARLATAWLAVEWAACARRPSEGCGFADRAGASTVIAGKVCGVAGVAAGEDVA